ncbi:GAF domain-containing sensor histidine kinase [Rubellimicrobium roseum]|uniref:histidine kinase n=1 Tax=Rubellimicrobium roseum TaxID=687525 RepID=A0A5C4NB98_9RHOB|nr:GAF domain-containing sensor histidine kinase [Rubellimicrobium roseum]TNC67210.1 GAF domain-containing sensor histidine kinase [Rubellimicrobium roseum]
MDEFRENAATTAERMAALGRLDILDTPPEPGFDDIVLLARELCQTPVALVSLVADDRQWFKAHLGFPQCQTPLDQSVCKYAMTEDDVLIIPDLRLDPRTASNTLVTEEPFIRFYAGASLRDPAGVPLGSVCVIDTKPRPNGLTKAQKAGLLALARQVSTLLETRRLLVEERHRMEVERKHERHVAELRERFIAVLGHDLRNPLAAIDAGLRIIERDPASARAISVMAMMKTSAVRMAKLIETTLDFARSRLGQGLVVSRNSDAPLQPVLEQIITELRWSHPDARIETRIALTRPVLCDPDRIGQMFSNLLSNALTHGDTAQPVVVTAATSEDTFVLSVANGGAPISPDMLEQLFQPFYQGQGNMSHGLGLGLYIAAEISRAHGGTMSATSTPEQTCFTFEMPLRALGATAAE